MVSVYLDYADPKSQPDGWHVCAQFALALSHPTDPTVYSSSREYWWREREEREGR